MQAASSRVHSKAPSAVAAGAATPKSSITSPISALVSGVGLTGRESATSVAARSPRPSSPSYGVGVSTPHSDVSGVAAIAINKGASITPKHSTPAASTLNGDLDTAGNDVSSVTSRSSYRLKAPKQATPQGSVLGLPPILVHDHGSPRTGTAHLTVGSGISSVHPAAVGPGSDLGGGPLATSRTTPGTSAVGGAPGTVRPTYRTSIAGSAVSGPVTSVLVSSPPRSVLGSTDGGFSGGGAGKGAVSAKGAPNSTTASSKSTLDASEGDGQSSSGLAVSLGLDGAIGQGAGGVGRYLYWTGGYHLTAVFGVYWVNRVAANSPCVVQGSLTFRICMTDVSAYEDCSRWPLTSCCPPTSARWVVVRHEKGRVHTGLL